MGGSRSDFGEINGSPLAVDRSDQIGLSLPSPHASTCGMGVVHTLLTQGVSSLTTPALTPNFHGEHSQCHGDRRYIKDITFFCIFITWGYYI